MTPESLPESCATTAVGGGEDDVEKQLHEVKVEDSMSVASKDGTNATSGSDTDSESDRDLDHDKVTAVVPPQRRGFWLAVIIVVLVLAIGLVCLVVLMTKQGSSITTETSSFTLKATPDVATSANEDKKVTDSTNRSQPVVATVPEYQSESENQQETATSATPEHEAEPTPTSTTATTTTTTFGDATIRGFSADILAGYETEEDFQIDIQQALEKLASHIIERNTADFDMFYGYGPGVAQSKTATTSTNKREKDAAVAKDYHTYTKTNNRKASSDEADFVKADQYFVYTAYNDYVLVSDGQGNRVTELKVPDMTPAKKSVLTQSTSDPEWMGNSTYTPETKIEAILVTEEHLVLIVSGYESPTVNEEDDNSPVTFFHKYETSQIRVYTKPTPSNTDMGFVAKKDVHGMYLDGRWMQDSDSIHIVTIAYMNLWGAIYDPLDPYHFMPLVSSSEYAQVATKVAMDIVPGLARQVLGELSSGGDLPTMLRINSWVAPESSHQDFDDDSIKNYIQVTSLNVQDLANAPGAVAGEPEPEIAVSEAAFIGPASWVYLHGSIDKLVLTFDRVFWSEELFLNQEEITFFIGMQLISGDGTSTKAAKFHSLAYTHGVLLDPESIDIQGNDLRVASTVHRELSNDNFIIVFDMAVQDGDMKERGRIQIGEPQEVITAARFGPSFSYATTFDERDPFYVLDLNGDVPTIQGTLKLNGFSNYLHPLDDHDNTLLVGIGRNTTGEGDDTRPTGLLLNVFDVSDPTNPLVRSSYQLDFRENTELSSDAEWDDKSVQYSNGKLTLPITIHTYPGNFSFLAMDDQNWVYPDVSTFDGFIVYDVVDEEKGIQELFRVNHHQENDEDEIENCQYCETSHEEPRSFMYDDGSVITIRDYVMVSTNYTTGEELWRKDVTAAGELMNCCR